MKKPKEKLIWVTLPDWEEEGHFSTEEGCRGLGTIRIKKQILLLEEPKAGGGGGITYSASCQITKQLLAWGGENGVLTNRPDFFEQTEVGFQKKLGCGGE